MSKYWRCRVDFWYKTRHSQPTPKRKCRLVLIYADDPDMAKECALAWAQGNAEFGPLLVGVEVPEIFSTKLPLELKP